MLSPLRLTLHTPTFICLLTVYLFRSVVTDMHTSPLQHPKMAALSSIPPTENSAEIPVACLWLITGCFVIWGLSCLAGKLTPRGAVAATGDNSLDVPYGLY